MLRARDVADDAQELIRAHTRSQDDFLALAEAVPHLVWMAAPDGTIVYFNQRWIEFTGVDVDSLVGQQGGGLIHPDDLERTWAAWRKSLAAGSFFETEYRLRRRSDRSYRWFLARACPIAEADGTVSRWIGTATDIDAQRRTRDSLQLVIDCANDLARQRNVDDICDRLATLATERFAESCIVALNDSGRPYRVAAIAYRASGSAHPLHETVIADVIETQSSVLENTMLVVPLATGDGPAIGALALFSSETARRFDTSDLAVAQTVARGAATTIVNAKDFERERRTTTLLRFVANATRHLNETFDVGKAMTNVLELATREIADIAYVWSVQGRALRLVAAAAREGVSIEQFACLIGERPLRADGELLLLERLSKEPYLLTGLPDTTISRSMFYDFAYDGFVSLDIGSMLALPLKLHGEPAGALVFVRQTGSTAYTEQDREIIGELARHATLAYGQAELFARERRISTELQRAMLPRAEMLPTMPGIAFDVVYHPSATEAQVGGDWYDAFPLPDGSLVISVGDVTGRGLGAAGLMGKLRQALGVVPLYETDPASMLDAVDLLLRQRGSSAIATAFIGVIDPQRRSLRYANAGHPPPLLRRGGRIEALAGHGLPLGLRDQSRGETHVASLEGAELLVLYTDGLIESTRDLMQGEAKLHDVLTREAVMFVKSPARMLCEACLPSRVPDDTAVMTLQFAQHRQWSFDAENARAAHDARDDFLNHLRETGADGDYDAAELIFGELIGNVVRHAPGAIEVQLEWRGERAVLHVTDRGPGFDRAPALPEDVMKESGRGLFIVESLAQEMHVEYVPGYGTHVWVELPLRLLRAAAPSRVG